MNKEVFKSYMETGPETRKQKYMFIVEKMGLAVNITQCGYRAVVLKEESDGFFNLDSFMEYLSEIACAGKQRSSYVYIPCSETKKTNDALQDYFKNQYLNFHPGWKLFRDKDYLEKAEAMQEMSRILERFVMSFDRVPSVETNLDEFHNIGVKGEPISVCDIAIVERLNEEIPFFLLGENMFIYQDGVYREDYNGVKMKRRIQSLMYRKFITAPTVSRVYSLLCSLDGKQKQFSDMYNYPVHWVNFKNGFYDPIKEEMIEHSPRYLSLCQIPFEYHPDNAGGEDLKCDVTKNFLASSLPDPVDQKLMWEYLGYSMTMDTQMQKFLMLLGNGGTGKSVLISIFQNIVGKNNFSGLSLQNLNEKFYATTLFGKLLNACGDIPCKEMKTTDVIKKIVGEDYILYEKKGDDPLLFRSYAKLLFSANAMPENLDDKSDAFYRRIMVLEMNQVVSGEKKDTRLKEKLEQESEYAIHMAMKGLHDLYERGFFLESENCKRNVEIIQRASDSVKAFTDEKLERKEGHRIDRSEMYRLYKEYCEENGRIPLGKSKFQSEMQRKGFQITKFQGIYKFKDVEELTEFVDASGEDVPFD